MFGVFGLSNVRTKQIEKTWPESANYGYFAGGQPTTCNTRLDFSTETVAYQTTIPPSSYYGGGVVNSLNYGYRGAGEAQRDTHRFDYESETWTQIPSADTNQNKTFIAAVNNPNYGYFAGGLTPGGNLSIVDRLDFSSETCGIPPVGSLLSQARYGLYGVYSSDYGYFGGGHTPPSSYFCTIDRLDFASETVIESSNALTDTRGFVRGTSMTNYGYFVGGLSPNDAPPYGKSSLDKLEFSTETVSKNSADLVTGRYGHGSVNTSSYGYYGSGFELVSGDCTIDRIDFDTDTASTLGSQTDRVTRYINNFQDLGRISRDAVKKGTDVDGVPISSTYGYFGGGGTPSNSSYINRISFSNETVLISDFRLTSSRQQLSAVSNSNYGYFGGGGAACTIDRLDFTNETVSAPDNKLTQGRNFLTGVSNSNYGYFGGGTPFVCTIDRLDFSNETVSEPSSNLTQARYAAAGVSNFNYGYFAGGFTPPSVCTIDRLEFSNETVSEPSSNLTQRRYILAGVSNFNYGYFAGGFAPPSVCTIDRLDFSNETVSEPSSNLTQARYGLAAVSNSNYGYFAGGFAPPVVTTIDRLEFSNETTSVPGPDLPQARVYLAAVSN